MPEMSVNNKTEINTEKIKRGLKFVLIHDTVDQIQCIMVPNKSLNSVESFRYIGRQQEMNILFKKLRWN
jgi:hypothetical protein